MIQDNSSLLQNGLTVRSVCLGLVLVVAICVGSTFTRYMVGSLEFTWSYFPVAIGCPFVLIIFANALVRRYFGRALSPAELAVMLIMGLVSTGIPIFITGTLLALIASPYYAATPENEWIAYIHPYLPDWAIPSSEGEAIRWFWEGLPSGQNSIPLEVWIGPLFWWISLILAVYFVCFCLVVILHRQWVVHERLIYPLTEMPRLLIEDRGYGLLHSRLFWIGFSLTLSMVLFNIISYFHPGFPRIGLWYATPLQFGKGFPVILIMIMPPILGFMFMASTSISFSIWFFYLLAVVQEGITNRIGYDVTSPDAFVWGMQSLSWQGWGAFTAMVLLSLWMGRQHLWAVCRQALGGRREIDDRDEMLSYRTAVLGGLAALLYIVVWLCQSGLDLYVALLFIFGVFIAYIGITRLVVQTGMYYLTTPVGGQAFTLALTGTGIGPANLVPLSLTYAWFGDVQSVFMPSAAHGARLDDLSRARRLLGGVMGLAVVVGFGAAISFVLYVCYKYGATNIPDWYFNPTGGIGHLSFNSTIRQLNEPSFTDWRKLAYSGIGALAYVVLALCQYRFSWWPLHPVGLAVAPLWMTRLCVVSVFFAWAFKSVILRLGGIAGYRTARPFFIGLIAGFFMGQGVSFTVDVFWFMGSGHGVPW